MGHVAHRARRLQLIREVARKYGGRCLSDEYVPAPEKMEFECREGHRWRVAAIRVTMGFWCATCRRRPKANVQALQAIAKARGGRCLSDTYILEAPGMRWRCAEGHEWYTLPGNIRKGSWCPRCAGRKSLADLQAMAAQHGGRCLARSMSESSHDALVRWECAEGHRFAIRTRCVQRGQWCPVCSKADTAWQRARARAEQLGGACLDRAAPEGRARVRWRCAAGHVWRMSHVSVARGSWCASCSGRRLDLEEMRAMAAAHGGRCISRKFVDPATPLRWECAKGHRWSCLPNSVRYQGTWCPQCLRDSKFDPAGDNPWAEALKQASSRGGTCLSDSPDAAKIRWRCAEGHEWTNNNFYKVARGTWCPFCSGRRLDITHMRATAAERGGRVISTKYVNASTKLQWECEEGHRWWATPSHVRNDHSWCPQCAWDRLAELRRSEAKDRR